MLVTLKVKPIQPQVTRKVALILTAGIAKEAKASEWYNRTSHESEVITLAKDEKKQPEKKFRIGYVEAAVWKADNGDFYNVTIGRSYKDSSGHWQTSDSFGQGDLLNAARALQRAEDWISQQ
ncbi:MAG TPA: hypothetical protein VKW08_00225 [Xanthobacteraceae bacterium]|nr:hypothetical protein [Xanthobacteraceae bacterium]